MPTKEIDYLKSIDKTLKGILKELRKESSGESFEIVESVSMNGKKIAKEATSYISQIQER
ncbi:MULTISPECIES: hypothetical protein [unclassified Oceanobacillus]|uniref:hypothetical protein n=1 Tax=unclassified Oceanobacillus TaxID=2630292 RepID=UPI001BE89744|nr:MULTISPECIES: hypothetical protein [unclassified Oceanobacillus]MBT2599095.1 hypothetical protein [Oceanobacillus sp. ISL-74]MBT2652013.1 hypothetical protein [Oceanobacillus sp. ISL-73]